MWEIRCQRVALYRPCSDKEGSKKGVLLLGHKQTSKLRVGFAFTNIAYFCGLKQSCRTAASAKMIERTDRLKFFFKLGCHGRCGDLIA